MKHQFIIAGLCVLAPFVLTAEEEKPEDVRAKHQEGAAKVADEQDELSADVQQLITEQTLPKVIELLTEVEQIMDEATENLAKTDTGGDTLAAQTEIIEKIQAAAEEKQKQGGGKSGGAMLDMMKRMTGKEPADGKPQKGDKANDKGGGGISGDSATGNEATGGAGGGRSETRRVPKAAGNASLEIPEEFRKALDAYNRGAEKKVK